MEKLTPREVIVLDLVKEGRENPEIADMIFVSVHTVKAHISSIIRKLEVRNRTHLVYIALKSGLID